MERVAAPLRELGARVRTGQEGRPPVTLETGGALRARGVGSEVASAQVKSAVLLAGVFAEGETTFTEPARSRDHTERLLRQMGVKVATRGTTVAVRGPARLSPIALEVPGDLSSAAFLLAAALIAPEGSSIALPHVGVNPTRAGFLDALTQLGARIQLDLKREAQSAPGGEPVGDLSASAQRLRGTELDGDLVLRAIDEVPILAVLGAVADGTTVIRGAAELRVKESDRLAQMARGLRAMGAPVEELPDGLRVTGGGRRLRGAGLGSAHATRIPLDFFLAGL